MSEKNNIDFLMKSILENAVEDVPEHVWEGVSAGLDRAARRRAAVLWLRRGAAGVAAAAAIVCGVFLAGNAERELVQGSGELVAERGAIEVIEPESVKADEARPEKEAGSEADDKVLTGEKVLIAEVKKEDVKIMDMVPESAAEAMEISEQKGINISDKAGSSIKVDESVESDGSIEVESARETLHEVPAEYFPENWGEDETAQKKRNVSLVLSGVAGTNNSAKQGRAAPMRSPGMNSSTPKTGIEETSIKSSFGIPLSLGVSVKFDLTQRWSLGIGVNYTFLSRQFFGTYTKVNEAGAIELIRQSTIRNQQHYIGIPVNAYYNIINSEKIYFYAYAGGAVERCLSDSYRLMDPSATHKETVKGVQLSANAGIGVEFMLGKYVGLYIDPSLRYYFNTGQPKSIRTVQPCMLGFEMGLRFRL